MSNSIAYFITRNPVVSGLLVILLLVIMVLLTVVDANSHGEDNKCSLDYVTQD